MDRSMAIRLWEDKVGDSGKAPTGVELHLFASTIEKAVREQVAREIGYAAATERAWADEAASARGGIYSTHDTARRMGLHAAARIARGES